MNLQREREESKPERTWGFELHRAAWYGFTLKKEGQREQRDLQRGHEEEKCLPLCLHTSCGHIQECSLSCRTKMWLPPAAEDDTFWLDHKNSHTAAGWFSFSIFTWNLFYLHQAECDWDDVNVTLSKCCLLFSSARQTHRNCCLELLPIHNTAHCLIPHWTLFSFAVTQLSLADHGKWKPLLMTPEKQLQHNKPRSSIHPLPWIPTAHTGTRACRRRGWKGRTRTCTRWNLAYPFPDLSRSAAPWTRKMLWWCRPKSLMSITGLMVTFLRLSPESPCPLLLIQ